ncbi:DUF6571 family protein [Streptomyces sp. NPDC020747]|uniref:DUF6571 family protein n=1 Tax=Streptomyces sp. NPDC020747 TaxID=3365086 RepID=UPI00378BE6C5
MNMDNEPYPGFKGMVQINEAKVTRAANAAAAKDAKRATKLAKKDPEDLSPEEFDEMQRNLSLTVAAATNSDSPAMMKWKKDMVAIGDDPIRDPGPAPHGDSGGPEGFIVMSNLMRYGDYDDKFLEEYGTALVKEDKRVLEGAKQLNGSGWGTTSTVNHLGNDEGNDPLTGYMKALANSPDAATKFFTAKQKGDDGKAESNFKYLFEERKWPDDSMPGKESVTGRNSMGHALEAATTGHRPGEPATAENVKHSKEQAGLFSALVNSVSEDQDRLRRHEYMSDSFANISAEYMPDLNRSLDSDIKNRDKLFPTSGTAAEIDKYDAVRFLHTVARNNEGYDTLNVSQHVYAAALMEQQHNHPNAYPESTEKTINKLSYGTGLFQGIIGASHHFQADKSDADEAARGDAWKEHASTWGGSVVGSATAVAMTPFTGPGGIVAGGLAGTAAGEVFNGILNGFGDDGEKQKEQVYQNVKEMDQVEHSAILTTQESAKAATGSEEAESEAGDEAGKGFRDATPLIEDSIAAQ